MRKLTVWQTIDAPASVLWELLTSTDRWPEWGPTVKAAQLDGDRLGTGVRGQVTTVAGLTLPFEITDYREGWFWAWKVAGVPATDHTVEAVHVGRCRVGFGVPWPVAGYLAVCKVALRQLETLAAEEGSVR